MKHLIIAVILSITSLAAAAQLVLPQKPVTACVDVNGVEVPRPQGYIGVWMPRWADPSQFVYKAPLLRPMNQDSTKLIPCPDGSTVVSPAVCPN